MILAFRGGSASRPWSSSLKAKVESVTGAPAADPGAVARQHAPFQLTRLPSGSYGVVSGSTLDLVLTATPAAVAAVVHVSLPLTLQSYTRHDDSRLASTRRVCHGVWPQGKDRGADWPGCGRAVAQLCCHRRLTRRPATRCSARFGVVAGSTIYLGIASQSLGCAPLPFMVHISAAGLAQQPVRGADPCLPRRISV